jgi:hypothetical protein
MNGGAGNDSTSGCGRPGDIHQNGDILSDILYGTAIYLVIFLFSKNTSSIAHDSVIPLPYVVRVAIIEFLRRLCQPVPTRWQYRPADIAECPAFRRRPEL